ncbi:MAG: hypothetical protein JXK07_08740 [Spirochaetes bacterium]|nr:hypothetical protein [Spirochaetota bacterium]MBN2772581.1 hypothetical protein [Spirochaetota bacterium]HRX15468.1 hypothetical protein [Spirochaetota bacterium]
MRKKVLLSDVVTAVKGRVLNNGDADYVRWVVSSGLMSDVLTTEEEEILLLSSLTTTQVVRTADMVGAHAILLACGKPISSDTVSLASELGITLISCEIPVFEAGHLLAPLFFGD